MSSVDDLLAEGEGQLPGEDQGAEMPPEVAEQQAGQPSGSVVPLHNTTGGGQSRAEQPHPQDLDAQQEASRPKRPRASDRGDHGRRGAGGYARPTSNNYSRDQAVRGLLEFAY